MGLTTRLYTELKKNTVVSRDEVVPVGKREFKIPETTKITRKTVSATDKVFFP